MIMDHNFGMVWVDAVVAYLSYYHTSFLKGNTSLDLNEHHHQHHRYLFKVALSST